MVPIREIASDAPRYVAIALVVTALLATPLTLLSLAALADDTKRDTEFRLYLAIPFIATADREPARLGFQLMQEVDDAEFKPLQLAPEMQTAVDLGFTTDGLAKFDINGADARSAYDTFARAIGLTPDEVELCRDSDCLDWVKPDSPGIVPATTLAGD